MVTFEEYERAVVDAACNILKEYTKWRGSVCVDTVRQSYDNNLPIEEAASCAADDTLYWDGAFI